VTPVRFALVGLALSVVLVATACGGSAQSRPNTTGTTSASPRVQPTGPPPRRFLEIDRRAHSVTVTLIASYNGTNGGYNFDGYSRELLWTVPRGWTVRVVCHNRGPLRHSCAVVRGANTTTPAFAGAETPQPLIGIEEGHTASFSFRATRTGVYRFTCLVPGHEEARMWDVLQVTRAGRPSVVDLQAR
jgi:hypothetical protein